MKSIEIRYLADHPELTRLLVSWFYDEWGKNNLNLTADIIEKAVTERMQRDKLPLCFVALKNSHPVATASLKIREIEVRPQYQHWLGNVYVVSEQRNNGIGSYIIEKTAQEAKRYGIQKLYLYTRDRENLYQRLGWKVIEQILFRDRKASVMVRNLAQEL